MGRVRRGGATVALALVLGVVGALLGAAAGARFVPVPGDGHTPAMVRGVVTDVAGSVPRLPGLVLAHARQLPVHVAATPDSTVGFLGAPALLLGAMVALAALMMADQRRRATTVMSSLPRRAPPSAAATF